MALSAKEIDEIKRKSKSKNTLIMESEDGSIIQRLDIVVEPMFDYILIKGELRVKSQKYYWVGLIPK